jgi:phage terminase large subunit-like protein
MSALLTGSDRPHIALDPRLAAAVVAEHAARRVRRAWPYAARPEQLAPAGDWRVWLFLAGRGAGKTRAGAEWAIASARAFPLVNLVGPTAADARDVMVEGESGILAKAPAAFRPAYHPSRRRLDWPNGAVSLVFTADEPDRLRGKQHHRLWGDELAAWRYGEAFDQAMLGLRLGADPRACFTSTPKPVRVVRELVAEAEGRVERAGMGTVAITRATTYANRANLAPAFLAQVLARYEGTRLGRQEILGELLEDVPGALWTLDGLDAHRIPPGALPDLARIVVGVDPAVSAGAESAETGIVVAGADAASPPHGYVLEDRSLVGSPHAWATAAVAAFRRWDADRIVAEANQGGEMVAHTIRTVWPEAPVELVHASRGKATRAEPVSALAEQGRWHHVGSFPALEDQLTGWVPGLASPDRLDAMVWAAVGLGLVEPVRFVGVL